MENLSKTPIDLIRDVLYNIEQFREDAFILPDINVKPQRTQAKTGWQNTGRTKSTGMSRSNNTLVGKAGANTSSTSSQGKLDRTKSSAKGNGTGKNIVGMSGQVYGAGAKSSGSLDNDDPAAKAGGQG